jgi:hypothetical protein
VEVIVQANVHRVDVVALQQVAIICIHIGDVKPGCDALGEGFVNICDSHDLRAGDLLVDLEMLLAALSCADHPDTHGLVF